MDWYIRTSIQSKTVEEILKKNLFLYKPYVRISPKLVDYLEENYRLNLNYVLKELINNIRLNEIEKDLLQITILDKKINKTSLKELVQLIEFGNRSIPPSKEISKLLTRALKHTKAYLEGE